MKTQDCLTKTKSGESNKLATDANLIKELVIGNDCLCNTQCHLIINNYPTLEKIWIKRNDLDKIESLTICDNEQLKEIVVEDGTEKDGIFNNVKSVVLKGLFF